MQKYDFTQKKLQPMKFPRREGIELSMDHRTLRKVVYSHPNELGLQDLGSRVPCLVQTDPNKYQRTDCWAITDVNIREAVTKILEFTTFKNPRIITLERYPKTCSTQKNTFFVDIVTGNEAYFRIGGKQDGKLWSFEKFETEDIINMMKDPNIKKSPIFLVIIFKNNFFMNICKIFTKNRQQLIQSLEFASFLWSINTYFIQYHKTNNELIRFFF